MMKGNMKCGCSPSKIGWVLVMIGGLNWGLVGLGMLVGGKNWNLVNAIFGGMMALEAIIYLLVGIAAVMVVMGCKCKTCKDGTCKDCLGGACDTHGGKKMDMEKKMPAEDAIGMPMDGDMSEDE